MRQISIALAWVACTTILGQMLTSRNELQRRESAGAREAAFRFTALEKQQEEPVNAGETASRPDSVAEVQQSQVFIRGIGNPLKALATCILALNPAVALSLFIGEGASLSSARSVGPNTKVQPLGFGTWAWGNKLMWGYDPKADAELQNAFDYVATPSSPSDSRRYFFDTGESYGTGALEGRAEKLLGKFRRESKAPERAVVGTKLEVYPSRLTGESFEEACRVSLARMECDKIELVQAHYSAHNFQPWQEPALWDGLARCYEAGLCNAVGTSNFGPEQLAKVNAYWRDRGVPHGVNQVQLSLLSHLPIESGLVDACDELGVQLIGYSPLALGVLSGKYDLDCLPRGPRGRIFKRLLPSLKPLLGTLRDIAETRDVSCSAVALNWAMSKGALVIVGMKTPEQVRENLKACGWRLSDAEVLELEQAAKNGKQATQNMFQTP